jgi:hypothetical protein
MRLVFGKKWPKGRSQEGALVDVGFWPFASVVAEEVGWVQLTLGEWEMLLEARIQGSPIERVGEGAFDIDTRR